MISTTRRQQQHNMADTRRRRETQMGEKTLQSLADRLMELEDIIEKENAGGSDFHLPDRENTGPGEETLAFVDSMKNINTVRKTDSDMRKLKDFFHQNGECRDQEAIPPCELNVHLANFFMKAKKNDGQDYEPETLKSIQGSINRYLNGKNVDINIITDKEFKHSRDVLASKRKLLRTCGKGNKVNRADPFTSSEINILYEKGQLGTGNARALVNTMFMNNTMHFGMRSCLEHVNLRWGDLELKSTSTGEEFLEYRERSTKTRTGTTSDSREFIPKMYEDKGNPRCPVAAYKQYAARRPEAMNNPNSPFYIGVARKWESGWFVNQAMGKNTIGNIVKNMCEEAGITGRKVNHSVRKTAITSLVHAGVPPTLVQQLSGHKNVNSINNYSFASTEQQKSMSSILTNFNRSSFDMLEDTSSSKFETPCSYNAPSAAGGSSHQNVGFSCTRLSQEIVEEMLNEIDAYENQIAPTSVTNMSNPQMCYDPVLDINPLQGHHSHPGSILAGAHIAGNVIVNFSNGPRERGKKRCRIIDSDSD